VLPLTHSRNVRHYDSKRPPPLALPEAYALAELYIGAATNEFWCVTAACQPDQGTATITHWEFGFFNTNGASTNLLVFFDKTVLHRNGAELVR
jgi:hypothetical protein